MLELVYATGNPAKLSGMRDTLEGLVRVVGLGEAGVDADVDESGKDPLENARIKAEAFSALLASPVLATDSGLYIDNIPEREQPGVHVRRVGGRRLSDAEMIAHYTALAARLGGRARAVYRNGLCVIAGAHASCTIDDVFASHPFYLVDRPHARLREGFPLNSVSVEMTSGMYYYDFPAQTFDSMFVRQAYRDFVLRALTGLAEREYACAMERVRRARGDRGALEAERRIASALAAAYPDPRAELRAVALAAIEAEEHPRSDQAALPCQKA